MLAILGFGVICLVLVVGIGLFESYRTKTQQSTGERVSVESGAKVDESNAAATEQSPAGTIPRTARLETTLPGIAPSRLPATPVPLTDARSLLNGLWSVDPAKGPLKTESITRWKQNLEQLIRSGSASVPAIAECLRAKNDISFGEPYSALLGCASTRAALFEVLAKIGGPEAEEVLVATLQQGGSAAEIRTLAGHLEGIAPGQYRTDLLTTARQTLESVRQGQLSSDVGPLFDVFRTYGDSSVTADLEAARRQWGHYACIALAGLPEGAGIPSLLAVAQTEARQKPVDYLVSFQLLAQASGQQESASSGLLDLAREGKIPVQAWPQISLGLQAAGTYQYGKPPMRKTSGYTTHKVSGGQQYFYTPPLVASQDAQLIQARLGFVDQLFGVVSDASARKVLDQTRMDLANKLAGP